MQRFHQLLFAVSLLGVSWYVMMAVHEFGHVVGVVVTGGTIERVVLHPLTISRTDISPNPHPAIVVWLGPVLGCILPLATFAIVPRRLTALRNIASFFAGFCLVANGTYISIGSFDRVGDCGEMLRTGTPHWILLAFGTVAIALGLYLWHGLGSVRWFLSNPSVVTPRLAYVFLGSLLVAVVAGFALSPL